MILTTLKSFNPQNPDRMGTQERPGLDLISLLSLPRPRASSLWFQSLIPQMAELRSRVAKQLSQDHTASH